MKTLVKTFAIALFTTVSFFATAKTDANDATNTQTTFKVGVYQTLNTMKVNVMIEKLSGKNLTVFIKNADGEVLHTERIGKKQVTYHGKFNLEDLENGKYSFEICDGKNKIVKNVEVGRTKVNAPIADRFISLN